MTSRIGYMQGRLCDQVEGKIQAFPWRDWEVEFPAAAAAGLHLMEWTLDQEHLCENPLMTAEGQARIRALCRQHGVSIPSLTGDCFMQAPFWKAAGAAKQPLQADFIAICRACSAIGIRMIVVPLVDNGRLETSDQEKALVGFLLEQQAFLASLDLQVIFESDYAPGELRRFISTLPPGSFGINYDIGNSAALGFDPAEEFAEYGSRVVNVHVKDRVLGGTTVPLITGNANFPLVFAELAKLGYGGNFILQTARAADGDHAGVLGAYRDMTMGWIRQSGLAIPL
ncbi:MAG: TIM barrel protein [Betaproteobacteria bacterium]|nr:TIM barrel protein [Betaproteobacteria bacterium]